jgi:TolB-like protein
MGTGVGGIGDRPSPTSEISYFRCLVPDIDKFKNTAIIEAPLELSVPRALILLIIKPSYCCKPLLYNNLPFPMPQKNSTANPRGAFKTSGILVLSAGKEAFRIRSMNMKKQRVPAVLRALAKTGLVCHFLAFIAVFVVCLQPVHAQSRSRRGNAGKTETAQPAPDASLSAYFSGAGGKNMSLAILTPEGKGLAKNQKYLPALVQGVFVSDISKYSSISVLDRQNTESGIYTSSADFVELGKIAQVGYAMTGSITKTASGYALQIAVTDTAKGVTKASYSGNSTIAELDNFTGIKKASLTLLTKLGVNLTAQAKEELSLAGSAQARR